MDAESRVVHSIFGVGTILETVFTAGSNLPAAKVSFDDDPERVLLLSALVLSETPGPASAKKPRRKVVKQPRGRKTDPVVEPITDKLLVPELDDAPTGESDIKSEETAALM